MRKRFEPQMELTSTPIEKIVIQKSRHELPAILLGLQWVFMNTKLRNEIFELLEEKVLAGKKATGRLGMSLWQIFVLGVLRMGLNANLAQLSDYANHHKLVRQMMGLHPYLGSCEEEELFSEQSICDNVNFLDEKLLEQINVLLVKHGREEVFKKKDPEGMQVKIDGYVVEADVHFPTDVNLLWDSGRKCLDLVEKLLKEVSSSGWRKLADWRKRFKSAKLYLDRALYAGGKNKEERVLEKALTYLEIAYEIEEKIANSLKSWKSSAPSLLLAQLKDFHGMLIHHLILLEDRLVCGKVIEHSQKYFSVFERHAEWINKGKSGKRVEIGHNVLISADENRLIVDYKVLEKESEKSGILGAADRLLSNYDEAIASISADKGFYSKENIELLSLEIAEVCVPKPGRKNKPEQLRESKKSFRNLRKKHSQIESIINSLEHHGLDRSRSKGLHGFQRDVGLGVIAYNLHQIGNKLAKAEEKAIAKREKKRRKKQELSLAA